MYYQQSIETVIRSFNSNKNNGLSQKNAKNNLKHYGFNLLPTKKKSPLFLKFFSQFKNFLVIVLILATVISMILGEIVDAVAIFTIVLLNAVISFIQEIQAEKTLESLREKEIYYALVVREGKIEKVESGEIVPGDIIILEEGLKVPADLRLIESYSLRVDESVLTGESLPVIKNPEIISAKDVPLGDRLNMIYKDTQILSGRGRAIAVATGSSTEIGKIASFLGEDKEEKTPLTKELEKVARSLTYLIGVIALFMFLYNTFTAKSLVESLLLSISLAVAAIPEGLVAIVTIVLSLGVKRLADKKSIIKKLYAAETLGAVKIIATDKTGTLTQNKINVVKVFLSDRTDFKIEGEGYDPTGTFFDKEGKIINPADNARLTTLFKIGILASNASLNGKDHTTILGDTTEGAILVAGRRAGLDIEAIRQTDKKIFEVPFSSERKMMSVVVEINQTGDHMLYSKGAPEIILERCRMSPSDRQKVAAYNESLSRQGYRTLAMAQKKLNKDEVKKALEKDKLDEAELSFLGIVGMQDPIRPEIREALKHAKEAGVQTIMITGDHRETALTIAKEAGIIGSKSKILTENEINSMTEEEIARAISGGVCVFSRISPMGKLKIIKAIKSIPHTQVAVTGDGVDDAPALKAADIGVAMGKTGTDITREVADMVMTDDNYATIISAIEEGRIIFANLVKFIRYLISCNLSEVVVVSLAVVTGTPLPLLPIQLLWINLITDGLPALALGVEPAEFDVMKKPPRDISVPILHNLRWFYMALEGIVMGLTVFYLYIVALNRFSYLEAQTMAFTALALSQMVHAFNNRSTRKSVFQLGIFTNKYLVGAVLISVFFQVLAINTGWGNFIFKTTKLGFEHWVGILAAAFLPFLLVEAKKQLRLKILP